MNSMILNSIDKVLGEAQLVSQRSGYSVAGCRILIALHMGAPLRVSEIADAVGITQQAVGKHLRELSSKGFCVINRDAEDGRARLVDLTRNGIKAVAKLEKVWR